jgi:antirestriction protein ArdC
MCSGYSSNAWCTYRQAQELGYQVRKGEKASPVVFWKFPSKDKAADAAELSEDRRAPFARFYSVFNLEQLDGVPSELPFEGANFDPIAECDSIVSRYMDSVSHPSLAHGGDAAYFMPSRDHVQMPLREAFSSPAAYYSTLFHEFAHSTGVQSRCNRAELSTMARFGDEDYSKEELCAEFAAAFLCGEASISNERLITNSSAYIQHWVSKLRNDKAMVVQAAQRAQKAADYILQRIAVTSEEVAA